MSTTSQSTTSTATSHFTVANGEIFDPDGNEFTARGIDVYDSQMDDAAKILADFPGINFVRLAIYSYQDPSAYADFIKTMTDAGVVVEVEDHTNSTGTDSGGGQGSAFTGSQLSNELAWYSSMASAYASNAYLWFGTDNEPTGDGLSTWEKETYNAIRSTGNENPILMELPGGGVPSAVGAGNGMDSSVYASMTNIVWDVHYYGWVSGYSTDQQTVSDTLTSLVTSAQTIQSADGAVPVIIGEYGPATDGQNTDQNADQVLAAVQDSTVTSGAVAWGWDSGSNDNLTDGSGNLTSFGQEVAKWIAAGASTTVAGSSASSDGNSATASGSADSNTGSTSETESSTTASANDTVVTAGSSAVITDASGNTWTLANGVVQENGQAAGYSADVTQIAYVDGTVWQQNTQGLWWQVLVADGARARFGLGDEERKMGPSPEACGR